MLGTSTNSEREDEMRHSSQTVVVVPSITHRTGQALKIRVWRTLDGGIEVADVWIPIRGVVGERTVVGGVELTLWTWVAQAKGIAAARSRAGEGYRTDAAPDPRPAAEIEQMIRDRQAAGLSVAVLRAELRRSRQFEATQRRLDARSMLSLVQALRRDGSAGE